MSELTEPQLRALKEIGSNRTHWDLIRDVLYNIEGKNEEFKSRQADAITSLLDEGFLVVGVQEKFTQSSRNIAGVECLASRISISDRGREVLADV